MSEQELAKKVQIYQDLAKQNPNVDIGLLMLNALQNDKKNKVSPKTKKWAYLISIGVPPFGLLFSLKYFFSDKDDAKEVAWSCLILTGIALFIFWITAKLIFSGSGASIQQIQQIKPSDALQLLQ